MCLDRTNCGTDRTTAVAGEGGSEAGADATVGASAVEGERGDLKRRSFLQTTALVGAGTVLGTQAAAQTEGTQCSTADRFVSSPNYSIRTGEIDWIVIHVTTGTYSGAITWFENPDSNVSAHYVVSNYESTAYEPGHVTQMVRHENEAWHARGIANPRSIGIELEWIEGRGEEPISEACYEAAADLVRCIADRYDVPLTFYEENTCIQEESGGIIGHTHVPDGSCASYDHDGRTCPYPDFDPDTFMSHVRETDSPDTFADGDLARATTALNGRRRPNLDSEVTRVLDEGTVGEVVNGPETVDGYTWWGLHVPAPSDWVWCVEEYLDPVDTSGGDDSGDDGDSGDDDFFCFLTTATADDRQTLDSLRRFRDESMSATPLGRRLVGLYYRISPPIAATLDRHPESATARAVRALVARCAGLSDAQAQTRSRVESVALGTVLTVLYIIGILVAACGHAGIRVTEWLES
jgi:hypothetical protein